MKRRRIVPRVDPVRLERLAGTLGIALAFAITVGGCSAGATAPPAYKVANGARLNAVAPWLAEYAAEHPDRRGRVEDVVAAWRAEVTAQGGTADTTGTAAAPARPTP